MPSRCSSLCPVTSKVLEATRDSLPRWQHYLPSLPGRGTEVTDNEDLVGLYRLPRSSIWPVGGCVSEGVSELVHEGSVGGPVWNVTHGTANSTAKMTGSLSDAAAHVTMDDKHEEHRQKIRVIQTAHTTDYIMMDGLLKGLHLRIS